MSVFLGETVFLGECPVIRPEGIYVGGRRVIATDPQLSEFGHVPMTMGPPGVAGVGVGDVGDLLAYRQMWEPFIAAHLSLWRDINYELERHPEAQRCPAGIFDGNSILNLPTVTRSFCAALLKSRMYTSPTYKLGILPQWNAWKGKSSAEMIAGAQAMIEWHQSVVMNVGGPYKDELVEIGKMWGLKIALPDLPSFSAQQELRARLEGAYTSLKGVIQILGYGVADTLDKAHDVEQALADGLSDTARQLPQTTRWIGIAVGVTAVAVAGALLVYYVPRRTPERPAPARP